MVKLTDSQLIVLSKAAARDDGVAVRPDHLSKAAALKAGASLVTRKLMREIRSKPGMAVWRQNDQERNVSLLITKAGRAAIGIEDDEVQRSARKLDSEDTPATANEGGSRANLRSGSKQARVVALLSSGHGVSVEAISEEMGWLSHTTRAVLTGLRKRRYDIAWVSDGTGKRPWQSPAIPMTVPMPGCMRTGKNCPPGIRSHWRRGHC